MPRESTIAIVPTADRQRATVKVRIGFAELDPRILPDMGVKVAFREREVDEQTGRARVVVPAAAVRKLDGRDVDLPAGGGCAAAPGRSGPLQGWLLPLALIWRRRAR